MNDEVLVRRPKRVRKRGGAGRVLGAALALLLVAAGVAVAAGWYTFVRPDHAGVVAGKQLEVTIERGATTTSIARQLSDAGVIRNARAFQWRARRAKLDARLKPGTYSLATGMPDALVLDRLRRGPDIVYYDVPIPEGFTIEQIAARFAARTGVSEDEFLALAKTGAARFAARHPYLGDAYGGSLQGYLFPKTYRVKKGTSAEQIIEMMLSQFDEEVATIDLSAAKAKGLGLNDVVTLASIIEREVRLANEYPLVSSVIYNRLEIRMRLQLDSTVFYFLPPGTKIIRKSDLESDNPYNTYKHYGLPPGPLANPGARALEAAAHPAKTKYLYYVLTGKDGSQTFTTNYADFLKAVQKYKSVFGK